MMTLLRRFQNGRAGSCVLKSRSASENSDLRIKKRMGSQERGPGSLEQLCPVSVLGEQFQPNALRKKKKPLSSVVLVDRE